MPALISCKKSVTMLSLFLIFGVVALVSVFFYRRERLLNGVKNAGGMLVLYRHLEFELFENYDAVPVQVTSDFLLLKGKFNDVTLFFSVFHTFNQLHGEAVIHYSEQNKIKREWHLTLTDRTETVMIEKFVSFITENFKRSPQPVIDCPYFNNVYFSTKQSIFSLNESDSKTETEYIQLSPSLNHIKINDGKVQTIAWTFEHCNERGNSFTFIDNDGNKWSLNPSAFSRQISKNHVIQYKVSLPTRRTTPYRGSSGTDVAK